MAAKLAEHRLDRFIRALLQIERRQIELDSNAQAQDIDVLQDLLDEVTVLRQKALGEFSAHELSEDRGASCFMDMCHELSQKINAKITRQRFDRQFNELREELLEKRAE